MKDKKSILTLKVVFPPPPPLSQITDAAVVFLIQIKKNKRLYFVCYQFF